MAKPRHRGLLIVDGGSDLPLRQVIRKICAAEGGMVEVVAVRNDQIDAGLRVADRVRAVLREDPDFQLVFVHRDAEAQPPARRFQEIHDGVEAAGFAGPSVGVVPIRMTEAWLLLDEAAIRQVAGRPRGRNPLHLPHPGVVESVPDPKRVLREALREASGVTGRRLRSFTARFSDHRRQLLDNLDTTGPVGDLSAWRKLVADVRTALAAL